RGQDGPVLHNTNPARLLENELDGRVRRILHDGQRLREARCIHDGPKLGRRVRRMEDEEQDENECAHPADSEPIIYAMVPGLLRPRCLPRIATGLLTALLLSAACSSSNNNGPQPSPPGSSGGNTITGSERLGWDQVANSASELSRLRYVVYVDGVRREMEGVSCAQTPGPAGYACSGRLPQMSPGTHVLELATV